MPQRIDPLLLRFVPCLNSSITFPNSFMLHRTCARKVASIVFHTHSAMSSFSIPGIAARLHCSFKAGNDRSGTAICWRSRKQDWYYLLPLTGDFYLNRRLMSSSQLFSMPSVSSPLAGKHLRSVCPIQRIRCPVIHNVTSFHFIQAFLVYRKTVFWTA